MKHPEHDTQDDRDPLAEQFAGSLDLQMEEVIPLMAWLVIAFVILAAFALWMIAANVDWSGFWDFIAPTAAQARDLGAHSLLERF